MSQHQDSYTFLDENGEVIQESCKSETEKKKQLKVRSRSSARDKKLLIYPLFQEMIDYTNDVYWINKLKRWANGKPCNSKFKVDYSISHITVKFSKNIPNGKCKIHRVDLIPNDPLTSLNIFKDFLEKHVGDVSDMDRVQRTIEENETQKEINQEKIKSSKNVLNTVEKGVELIDKYVSDTFSKLSPVENCKLSEEEVIRSLKDCVKLLILSKNHKNIVLDETKSSIVEISDIERCKDGSFRCNIPKIKSSKNTKNADMFFDCGSDDEEEEEKKYASEKSFRLALEKEINK